VNQFQNPGRKAKWAKRIITIIAFAAAIGLLIGPNSASAGGGNPVPTVNLTEAPDIITLEVIAAKSCNAPQAIVKQLERRYAIQAAYINYHRGELDAPVPNWMFARAQVCHLPVG